MDGMNLEYVKDHMIFQPRPSLLSTSAQLKCAPQGRPGTKASVAVLLDK